MVFVTYLSFQFINFQFIRCIKVKIILPLAIGFKHLPLFLGSTPVYYILTKSKSKLKQLKLLY
jgi:hypothetical protein